MIGKIMRTIINAYLRGEKIIKKKIEAQICLEEGFTRRKAQEYINLLIDAEKIEEMDGLLTLSSGEIEARELDKLLDSKNEEIVDSEPVMV